MNATSENAKYIYEKQKLIALTRKSKQMKQGIRDLDHGLSKDLSKGFSLESGGGESCRDDSDHPAPEHAGATAEVEVGTNCCCDRCPENCRMGNPRPGSRRRLRGVSAERHGRAQVMETERSEQKTYEP